MKLFLVLSIIIATTLAAPQTQQRNKYEDIRALSSVNEQPGDGTYNFKYDLTDGTKREEHGELRSIGDSVTPVKTGKISWEVDGQVFTLEFIADENGFRPVGSHLPK